MKKNNVSIRELTKVDMVYLWNISSKHATPQWAKYNAPYFQEYKQMQLNDFLQHETHYYIQQPANQGIFYQEKLVGNISHYWEHMGTRWMEFGIVIYDDTLWGKQIGYDACSLWIDFTFAQHPEIMRLGCTTWSGNPGMMHLAEKLGMQQEGRIRKVRYYDGIYYDSLRYGILREEWEKRKEIEV